MPAQTPRSVIRFLRIYLYPNYVQCRTYGSHEQKVCSPTEFLIPYPLLLRPALASKRGLRTWPKGTGWPTPIQGTQSSDNRLSSLSSQSGEDHANLKLAERQEDELAVQAAKDETTGDRGAISGEQIWHYCSSFDMWRG